MELLEVKLLHKYSRIRSYMNDLISGDFIVYDFMYVENEKIINIYYDQLLKDSKEVSSELYTFVITCFEDNEWRF